MPPLPTGVGNAVMEAFGLKPSRQIGEIKRLLEEAIASGELEARQENDVYVELVKSNRDRFGL